MRVAQRGEFLLRVRDAPHALGDHRALAERRRNGALGRLEFAPQRGLTLHLRGEPVGLRVERGELLELRLERLVVRALVAGGEPRELLGERGRAQFLLRDVAAQLLKLRHRHLDAAEFLFQRAGLLHGLSPLFVERHHVARHLLELLEPLAEVRSVGAHRFELAVEELDDGAQVVAERPAARRAGTFRARGLELVLLVAQLLVLGAQRAEARLCLLAVAHPLGAPQLEPPLQLLQPPALLLQLLRDLLLERRRGLHARTLLARALQFTRQLDARFLQRLPPSVRHGQFALARQLLADVMERREPLGERHELRARLGHVLELGLHAFDRAIEPSHLRLEHAPLGVESLQLVAAALRQFPSRLQRIEVLLSARLLGGRGERARLRLAQAGVHLGELPREHLGVGHAGAHAVALVAQRLAAVVAQVLRGPQLLVPEHARQELRARRRAQRRHHGEFLLRREVRVVEFLERHAEPATHEVGHRRRAGGDGAFAAVEVEIGGGERAHETVAMPREVEVQLDAHRGAGRGARKTNGVHRAAGGVTAVQRPLDGLEDRRLADAVGADDAREPALEQQRAVGVLPEVDEPQPGQPHGASGSPMPRAAIWCSASRR